MLGAQFYDKIGKIMNRKIRHKRVRAKIQGTRQRPRLFVFKSNKHLYGSLIDDISGKTLLSLSDKKLSKSNIGNTKEAANLLGKELAKSAISAGYKKVVFDRGGYKYHGKIKELAEGAREGGLQF